MPTSDLRRNYKIRLAQANSTKKCYEVTLPFEVIEREARNRDLSIEEFITEFQAVAHFNGFEGVNYTFEEKLNGK